METVAASPPPVEPPPELPPQPAINTTPKPRKKSRSVFTLAPIEIRLQIARGAYLEYSGKYLEARGGVKAKCDTSGIVPLLL
jgi:hypothetical protein